MDEDRKAILGAFGIFTGLGALAVGYKLVKKQPLSTLFPSPNLPSPNLPAITFPSPQVATPTPTSSTTATPQTPNTPITDQPPNQSTLPNMMVFPWARLQYASVPPNTQQTVWLGTVQQSYAAVIQYVGNTYVNAFLADGITPALTLRWTIDGDLVENVQRVIADINNPKLLDPPYMALKEIRWLAINNHPTLTANINIVQDGFLQKRTDNTG